MHIKWLEDFIALAETQSFSRAAEVRHVTQPALSRRIQALEDWLNVELVDRSTHPFALTRAGHLFYEQSPDILLQLHQLQQLQLQKTLQQEAHRPGERYLRIASGHTLAASFLPLWLREMHQKIGNFNSRVNSTGVREAVASLEGRNIDLVLCYSHPLEPVQLDSRKYEFVILGHETMLPVSAPDASGHPVHALPGSKDHPVNLLSYCDDTFMHKVVNIILTKANHPFHLALCYETSVSLLMRKMTQQGHGLAWLPESLIAGDLANGGLVLAGDRRYSTALEIRAYRVRDNANPVLQQLWEVLQPPA
jgi:DNA-binding transcriptional LysR family regulator